MKKKRTRVEETKWSTDPKERIPSEDYLVYVAGGSQWGGEWIEEIVEARWNGKTSAWEYSSPCSDFLEETEQVYAWLRIPPLPDGLKQAMSPAKRRFRELRKEMLDYLGIKV